MSTKTCTTCKAIKPTNEFHRRSASRDGFAASCKECINAKNREKYETDPDYRAYKIVQAADQRARAA